jgi:hypothetical protein
MWSIKLKSLERKWYGIHTRLARTKGKNKIQLLHIVEDARRDPTIMKREREVAAWQAKRAYKFYAPGNVFLLVFERHFVEMRMVMAMSSDCKSVMLELQDLVGCAVRLGATQVVVEVNFTQSSDVIDDMFIGRPQCSQFCIKILASTDT